MTKTFDELDDKVMDIARRLSDLEARRHDMITADVKLGQRTADLEAVLTTTSDRLLSLETVLLGDRELQARYEAGKPNYPNIPKPPPGALDRLSSNIDLQQASLTMLSTKLDGARTDVENKLKFVSRLEAFFGPLLKDKNPPLDGDQIATKAYVDEAIVRIARVIRDELSAARELASELLTIFNSEQSIKQRALKLRERIEWLIHRDFAREQAEVEAKNKPSRLSSLVYAVTGFEKRNGEHR